MKVMKEGRDCLQAEGMEERRGELCFPPHHFFCPHREGWKKTIGEKLQLFVQKNPETGRERGQRREVVGTSVP